MRKGIRQEKENERGQAVVRTRLHLTHCYGKKERMERQTERERVNQRDEKKEKADIRLG